MKIDKVTAEAMPEVVRNRLLQIEKAWQEGVDGALDILVCLHNHFPVPRAYSMISHCLHLTENSELMIRILVMEATADSATGYRVIFEPKPVPVDSVKSGAMMPGTGDYQ